MSESIYQDANAQITRTIAVIRNISYPINGITAVYVWRKKLSIAGVGCGVCVALFAAYLLTDPRWANVGWLLLAGGVLIVLYNVNRPYWLMLRTAGGDSQALQHKDGAYLQKIREAIEQAVASRG